MFKKVSIFVLVAVLGVVSVTNAAASKVFVCHNTGSDTNPVFLLEVSENAVDSLLAKGDYLLPEGQLTCQGGDPVPE